MTEPVRPTLYGVRVLDLTNHRGELAGRLLGEEVAEMVPGGAHQARESE